MDCQQQAIDDAALCSSLPPLQILLKERPVEYPQGTSGSAPRHGFVTQRMLLSSRCSHLPTKPAAKAEMRAVHRRTRNESTLRVGSSTYLDVAQPGTDGGRALAATPLQAHMRQTWSFHVGSQTVRVEVPLPQVQYVPKEVPRSA
eukprot:5483147-Amphidinium_carterae.1